MTALDLLLLAYLDGGPMDALMTLVSVFRASYARVLPCPSCGLPVVFRERDGARCRGTVAGPLLNL